MKKSELFEAFDLFDVRDFGKVRMLLIISQVTPVFCLCTEDFSGSCDIEVVING